MKSRKMRKMLFARVFIGVIACNVSSDGSDVAWIIFLDTEEVAGSNPVVPTI